MQKIIWMLAIAAMIWPGCAHSGTSASQPAGTVQASPDPSYIASAAQTVSDDDEDLYADEDSSDLAEVPEPDPLHLWNLAWFHFNDTFYFAVLKPVASAYGALVPVQIRKGINNFFHNIAGAKRFINCLLQGKGTAAEGEFVRFFMNSTIGVLGLGNPAGDHAHLNPPEEDLGQTLGAYGLKEGVFIVWPLLGQSSLRDTIGFAGDSFLSPITYLDSSETRTTLSIIDLVNKTSFRIGDYEAIKDAAIDPYDAVRDGYLQYRRKEVLK